MECPLGVVMVVANSARMLAQAAFHAGFAVLAIDCFGDVETRQSAIAVHVLPSLEKHHLLPAIDHFMAKYAVIALVYGSGFEQYPDALAALQGRLAIYGNGTETFAALLDKPSFFQRLESLDIPFPQTRFTPPTQDAVWLVKPMRGQGGLGIRHYKSGDIDDGVYYQKYQDGVPHSVLFLADGASHQIVGFNRQWTLALNDNEPFVFSRIINSTGLDDKHKSRIGSWLAKLVPELHLKGLNSLDFIQDGDNSYLLEINPRPPASMVLYDADLFVRHISACQGELLPALPVQQGVTGYQIVYALQDYVISEAFKWPEGSQDIPQVGSLIRAGQPICSIITHQTEPQAVHQQLAAKQAHILNQLDDRFQHHGIQRQCQ